MTQGKQFVGDDRKILALFVMHFLLRYVLQQRSWREMVTQAKNDLPWGNTQLSNDLYFYSPPPSFSSQEIEAVTGRLLVFNTFHTKLIPGAISKEGKVLPKRLSLPDIAIFHSAFFTMAVERRIRPPSAGNKSNSQPRGRKHFLLCPGFWNKLTVPILFF